VDESSVDALGSVLEPHVENIFQLNFWNDKGARKIDAHCLEVAHIVLVGENKYRQRVFHVQTDTAAVEEVKKARKHGNTHGFFH